MATVKLSDANTARLDELCARLTSAGAKSGGDFPVQTRDEVLNSVLNEYFRRDPLDFNLDRDAR